MLSFWALSRFADVAAALVDWKTYSSAEGILLERMDPRLFEATPMMLFLDPPRHDRLRRLVASAFTPRQASRWKNLRGAFRATPSTRRAVAECT